MKYKIEIEDGGKEKVYVICPSAMSAKEWIYTRLLAAVREDLKADRDLASATDMLMCYTETFRTLQHAADEMLAEYIYPTMHNARYIVSVYDNEKSCN